MGVSLIIRFPYPAPENPAVSVLDTAGFTFVIGCFHKKSDIEKWAEIDFTPSTAPYRQTLRFSRGEEEFLPPAYMFLRQILREQVL